MKKTLQDIEQIITDGQIPEREQFREHLFQHLSKYTTPASQHTSMIKKFISFWTLTPLALGVAALAFVLLQNTTPQSEDTTPRYVFSKVAFAASLDATFGLSTNSDMFRYSRITYYNLNRTINSGISERWQYKNNYRDDVYSSKGYYSDMNSAEELKWCHAAQDFADPSKKYTDKREANCDSDLSANALHQPNEDETTAKIEIDTPDPSTGMPSFNVILTTSEPLSETDTLLTQYYRNSARAYKNIYDSHFTLNPDQDGYGLQMNIQTDKGYVHILSFKDWDAYCRNTDMECPHEDISKPEIWYMQLVRGEQYSNVFEVNITTKEVRVANEINEVYVISSFNDLEWIAEAEKKLFSVTSAASEPISTKKAYYRNAAAVEIEFIGEDGGSIQFTQLIADNSIVKARVLDSSGNLLNLMTVEESKILLNEDPKAFFTQEYWENDSKSVAGVEGEYNTLDPEKMKQWLEDTNAKISAARELID